MQCTPQVVCAAAMEDEHLLTIGIPTRCEINCEEAHLDTHNLTVRQGTAN